MTITSLAFVAFVAGSVLVFRMLSPKLRGVWLLVCSLVFSSTWSLPFTVALALLGLGNFLLGKKVFSARDNKRLPAWLWTGLLFNLAFLVFARHMDFFVPGLMDRLEALSVTWNNASLTLLVPIGISFLFVQCVIYLLDIYHQRVQAETRLLSFLVYLFYFPKLLSGPIEKPKVFLSRLENPSPFTKDLVSRGLVLIGSGLLRKLLIADPLTALLQPDSFINPSQVPLAVLFFDLLAYAFALYNDFAGYSSIVRGVSLLFGIDLNQNFNLPYLSRNFNEFWGRWHISLSDALRDYVYFPLSRWLALRIPKRDHVLHLFVPPMITMLASGLWHGLGWNMLVWGGLHGLFQVAERILRLRKNYKPIRERCRVARGLSVLLVFALVLIAWIPFRMELPVAGKFFSALLPSALRLQPYLGELSNLRQGNLTENWLFLLPDIRLMALVLFAVIPDLVRYWSKDEFVFLRWPVWLKSLSLSALILALAFVSLATYRAPFVYQGF